MSDNKPSDTKQSSNDGNNGLSYKDAGVDIAAADRFVDRVKGIAQATHTPAVVNKTAYAGLLRPMLQNVGDPLIAATCDGVGTKLLVAHAMDSYQRLGQDLVGMNVNDLLPAGAQPLLFLDYIATGKLDPEPLAAVVQGVADACKLAGCALLGGETAEMPGVYEPGAFDLAGFAVGVVDGERVPDPKSVRAGDVLLGLPSSGVHSNGLSLARRALEHGGIDLHDTAQPGLQGRAVGDVLLDATCIYVATVRELMQAHPVKAAAHITGGGLLGRTAGLVLEGQHLQLDRSAVPQLPIFSVIQQAGSVSDREMFHTFNMGVGYVVAVDAQVAERVLATAQTPWLRLGSFQGADAAAAAPATSADANLNADASTTLTSKCGRVSLG